MKKSLGIFIVLATLSACDTSAITDAVKQVEEAKKTFKEVKGMAKSVSKLAESAKDLESSTKRLEKLTPISKEKIKAWMPKELDGKKRTKFTVATKLGVAEISNIDMTFESSDKKNNISVKIIDGAGAGVAILSPVFMAQNMELDIENEKGYQRTEKRDGNNVLVEYSNPPNEKTSMKYVYDGRFLVEINGKMKPDALWKINNALHIEKLNK